MSGNVNSDFFHRTTFTLSERNCKCDRTPDATNEHRRGTNIVSSLGEFRQVYLTKINQPHLFLLGICELVRDFDLARATLSLFRRHVVITCSEKNAKTAVNHNV